MGRERPKWCVSRPYIIVPTIHGVLGKGKPIPKLSTTRNIVCEVVSRVRHEEHSRAAVVRHNLLTPVFHGLRNMHTNVAVKRVAHLSPSREIETMSAAVK